MVQRQLPKPTELATLMQVQEAELNATERRLDKALTIADLRRDRQAPHARRRRSTTPTARAEGELSLARARQAFEDIEFHPDILRAGRDVDTTRRDPRRHRARCPSASPRPASPA